LEVDVLIVGAGPAGSTTARYCAGKDTRVLVIDRRHEIGYPVQCGEFLPSAKEMYSMFPKSMDLEELFAMDDGVVAGEVSGMDLVSPGGKAYRCPFEGVTLDRRASDKYLAKLAVESGAELRTGASLLSVGSGTAKTTIGDVMPEEPYEHMDIKGRDLVSGVPKTLTINSAEIRSAISEQVDAIVDAVKMALELTPPELSADIVDQGIVLTGGGALLRNLDQRLNRETGLPIIIADDPLSSVVLGSGAALDNIDILKEVKINW